MEPTRNEKQSFAMYFSSVQVSIPAFVNAYPHERFCSISDFSSLMPAGISLLTMPAQISAVSTTPIPTSELVSSIHLGQDSIPLCAL